MSSRVRHRRPRDGNSAEPKLSVGERDQQREQGLRELFSIEGD